MPDVLRVERDLVVVEMMAATKPDPLWRYTDQSGHEHRWEDGFPTLREVAEPSYWCASCRDEHVDVHLERRDCGETIEPRYVPDHQQQHLSGPTHWYLNDEPITEAEAQAWLSEQQRA